MNERELQKEIQSDLTARGVKWWHVPQESARYRKQLADILDLICIGNGRCFFIEVKVKSGKVRPGQAEFIDICVRNKVPCFIARSMDEYKAAMVQMEVEKLKAMYRKVLTNGKT